MRLLIACLLLYSVSSVEAQEAVHPDSAEILAKIEKAWKEREAKVKSFDATWKMETIYVKGMTEYDKNGRPYPEVDTRIITELRLVCENEKIMWVRSGQEYNISSHQFVNKRVTTAFNGKERRNIWDNESTERQHAFTFKTSEFLEKDPRVYPMMIYVRPFSLEQTTHHLNSDIVKAGGRFRLPFSKSKGDWIDNLEIDSSDLSKVLSRTLVISHKPYRVITFTKFIDSEIGLLPTGWTCVQYSQQGELESSSLISNVEFKINEPVDVTLFTPEFAPRTLIRDEATQELSIVRKDKSIRKVLEGESGIPYDTLAEMPELPEAQPPRMLGNVLFWSGVVIGIIGVLYLLKCKYSIWFPARSGQ